MPRGLRLWIAADEATKADEEADRIARGELTEIEQLRIENTSLRAELEGRTITPADGDIVPPSEQTDRHLYRGGPRPGPDDPKPPVTVDAKPEGSWTGPQDGPPSWLRPVPPTDPAERPPASPPVAKSGAEAERQRQRANSDRSAEHKVMGSARMVQPDNLSSGFFWGGASGKRAW